jgi:hypothetical protein
MPTDVSGTINIIAEVVGNSSSPVAGTGSSTTGKPKKDQQDNQNWIKDIWKSSQKMVALLGIGGLLASSKIVSSTMGSIMRIFGTFMDIIIGPIAPLLIRGLVILATVVMWIRKLLTGEAAWSDAWAGLKQWWQTTWEEKGGLWGIIKEGLANTAGVVLIAALFGSVVATPIAGAWVMNQFFGKGWFLLKSLVKGAIGLGKFLFQAPFKFIKFVSTVVSTGFQFAKYIAQGGSIAPSIWLPQLKAYVGSGVRRILTVAKYKGLALFNKLPPAVQRPLLAASALLGKMFAKAAIFTKAMLRRGLGLLSWAWKGAMAAGRFTWSALIFGGQAIKWTTLQLLQMLGLKGLFSAVGTALLGVGAALLVPALIGLLIIGAGIGVAVLADMLFKKAFGTGWAGGFAIMNRAMGDPAFAAEHGIDTSWQAMALDPVQAFNPAAQASRPWERGAVGANDLYWIMYFQSLEAAKNNPEILDPEVQE